MAAQPADASLRRHACYWLIPLVLLVAAGCGKREDQQTGVTQVAAKVDADEITVHQINAILVRTPNVTPEAAAQTKREILERLVDQQLAAQQAIRRKLDRSPQVVQTLEAARLEILARAYADEMARSLQKPTQDEVRKYYSDHPELFAQRRIYSIEDISVAAKEGLVAGLREQVAKAHSMQEISAWLRSQSAEFSENRSARAAEQLPLDALGKLQTMKDGEIRLFESGASLNVIRVVSAKTVPVDEAAAAPRIQQFLFNRRLTDAVQREMKQIKGAAKIQYFGEFAGTADGEPQKSGGNAAPAKAAPAVPPKTGG